MKHTQLIKGILEGCVLAIIEKADTYGYEILVQLQDYGFTNLIEGTLYPVLTRLLKKGYIDCKIVKSPYGPMRKNYSITNEGTKWLLQFIDDYQIMISQADKILLSKQRGNDV